VDLSVGLFEARDRLVEAYERAHIERALAEKGHNVTRTAKRIGVERITLQRAMKRLGLRGGTDD
jgi:transcriptional regulator with PAS, ATPase and Fis domain